ncbi:MAG: hypothetical protein IH852_04235 [Bacteroidetes bacterium]|nr:hypothetical protein [Bacteroidota bacterium]
MLKIIQVVTTFIMIIGIFSTGYVDAQNSSYKNNFDISNRSLVSSGRNDYFILEPGFQIVLEGSTGFLGMTDAKLVITVLDETKEVDGFITRVVEEREFKNDELYEVARNIFEIDNETGDVFYFGEEVDFYSDGEIVNHKGAWLAGINGAMPGLIMAGKPKVGLMYYQEVALGVAMDRAEIITLDEVLETSASTFTDRLKTKVRHSS